MSIVQENVYEYVYSERERERQKREIERESGGRERERENVVCVSYLGEPQEHKKNAHHRNLCNNQVPGFSLSRERG